jgi:hypothetical protein
MATVGTRRLTVFCLRPDPTDVNSDLGFDTEIIPFEGLEDVSSRLCRTSEEVPLPDVIEFRGLLQRVRATDFPVTNRYWPLISKRMLNVLTSVSSFPHQAIPTRIIEGSIGRRLRDDPRYDVDGNIKPEFYTDDYVLLQLTEHIDALDLEKSEYEEYYSDINAVEGVEKYVFKEPKNGFPPIFRLSVEPVPLYISHDAKNALEKAEIKGLWLIELGL